MKGAMGANRGTNPGRWRRKRKATANASPAKLAPLSGARVQARMQATKKDLVEAVRRMTPSSSRGVEFNRRRRSLSLGAAATDAYTAQLKVMEDGINLNARKFNEIKVLADTRSEILRERLAKLRSLKIEGDALREMKAGENPDGVTIRGLLERISIATRETDEKLRYRRQLEHMSRRLMKNDVAFDAHLRAMEETLESAEREEAEIGLLMQQLEAGRAQAVHELEAAILKMDADGRERSKLLKMKEEQRKNASKMEEWRTRREAAQAEMASQVEGSTGEPERTDSRAELEEWRAEVEKLRGDGEEKHRRAMQMEEAITRIRQATGVSTLDEMVAKLKDHGTARHGLVEEKRDAEEKLAAAKAAKEAAEGIFTELREAAAGTGAHRGAAADLSAEIQGHRAAYKASAAKTESLHATLVALREGTSGLLQRLQGLRAALDGPAGDCAALSAAISETAGWHSRQHGRANGGAQDIIGSGDAVQEGLHHVGTVLGKMMDALGRGERASSRSRRPLSEEDSVDGNLVPEQQDVDSQEWSDPPASIRSHRNNIRVPSVRKQRETEASLGEGGGETDEGRHKLVENVEDMVDEDAKDATADLVPTRQFLKLSATRQHGEMLRKHEAHSRRQLSSERRQEARKSESAPQLPTASGRRAQAKTAERLSAQPPSIGLPPGITARSDAMERSQAFITTMPILE